MRGLRPRISAPFLPCGQSGFYGCIIARFEHDGRLIGTIGAYEYNSERNCIEIGLSIEKESWGNGYATEALNGVIGYLTEHEGIDVITAWCAADNTGSKRAMEKAGMRQVAVEKEALKVDGNLYDKLVFEYVSRL